MILKKITLCALALASTLFAGGGSSGGSGKTGSSDPPAGTNAAEIRISNYVAPAGGTAQITFTMTSPQPILSGGGGFGGYDLNGAALTSPLGDAAGVAFLHNGIVQIDTLSPLGDLGTGDYPFLAVTMTVPSNIPAGTTVPMDLLPGSTFSNNSGLLSIAAKPGTLTIGGNFSISEVRPGGGTWPGGTVVRVFGNGFQPNASLQTPKLQIASYSFVSPTEMDFVLKEQTTLDAQAVQISSGGATQLFYSYLRGAVLQPPSRPFLLNVDPMFQRLTHALAQAGPFAAFSEGQYIALALQNPNPGPAAVTLTITRADGAVSSNLVVLPPGSRVMDDLAALVGLNALAAGDTFNLVSTTPVQILGINVDESRAAVTPFLPSF